MRMILLLLAGLLFSVPEMARAQMQWTDFAQLEVREKAESRPVLIFITAPWCVYCKAMKSTTFKNRKLADALNRDFYVVELDAEKDQELRFNGKNYRYRPNGNRTGLQELAVELGTVNGQMSYPTLVFLKPGQEGKLVYPAFASAKELRKMAEYVLEQRLPVR
ncbi:MAG: thioredoxin family protein [Mucilaginibacter polytrichastri]|nr:thioredoxin family protein [Mucilaginibacter polytrichastri]